MILTINGIQAALKKGSSIEYVSVNRLFTDADDYSMEIELPLADCPQNLDIFGMITRKDVDAGDIFFDAVLQDTNFFKRGAVVITGITNESVKVQFLERRSYQNFFPRFDETYIDELDLGVWPNYYQDNLSSSGHGASPRPGGGEVTYVTPAQIWARWQDFTALPWVNNTSGNLQNAAKWNASLNKYEWKVNPVDDDDTDYSRGLSFQPNLLWLTKKICEVLGYTYDFSLWEGSDYRYLFIMNCTPYANSNRTWASALPHWTVNEFFQELEKLLIFEFDIDHARSIVVCSATADNVADAGSVHISKVIDAFSVEVTTDEEKSGYKAMLNQGYGEGGFTRKGRANEVAGVVHAGEWVASQKLLASPVARPLIEALDYAQRTNTIGSLKSADVSRSITAPMALTQSQPQVIIQENKELKEIIARLSERLDEPFVTVNTVTGDMGIKQAQDEYQRLMNNKSPKNKRK